MGIAALVLLAVADVFISSCNGRILWPVFLLLPLGLAAVLRPCARRPAWLTPELRASIPAGVSLALAVGAATTERVRMLGPGEWQSCSVPPSGAG